MDYAVKFFADWSGYVLIALIGAWCILSYKKRLLVLLQMGIAAFISRGIITETIRFFWHRQRPLLALSEGSFPSGHASFYFALAAVLYFYNKKLGVLAFAISIAMGVARVFAGYHWPSDIVGGAFIGIASGFLVVKLSKFYVQKS